MASYQKHQYETSEYDSSNNSAGSDSEYKPEKKVLKLLNSDKTDGFYKRKRSAMSNSKNALLARQNRLKNKQYLATLESNLVRERAKNFKANSLLKDREEIIKKQEREVKYLKSVIANSSVILKLLRNIHGDTGMKVGTSIDKSLHVNENSTFNNLDANYGSDLSPLFPNFDEDVPLNIFEDEVRNETSRKPLGEHNYTLSSDCDSDVGVCLHVSNHRVALEFCSTCNDNANELWSN